MATDIMTVTERRSSSATPELWKKSGGDPIFMIDPSELLRPNGKKEDEFRNFSLDQVSFF